MVGGESAMPRPTSGSLRGGNERELVLSLCRELLLRTSTDGRCCAEHRITIPLWGLRMRLLASTDYALRLLMALGESRSGETINVGTLATSLGGLSRNHLHKIVQDLAAIGIVKTIRGAGGGVVLAKAACEVRVGAVVRALEEDQAIVECFRADHGCCTLEPGCRLRPMLREARESFYEALDAYTLADCLRRPAAR